MNTSYNGDKIVEWEVTMKCNYRCTYCTNLDQSIEAVEDTEKLRHFIQMLGETHPGTEVFVFGGEPFLHPNIDYIIQCFNEFNIPYVIQTNFSKKSVVVMSRIKHPFKINISIHPTEVEIETVLDLFSRELDHVSVGIIDVMYTGKEAIDYYISIKKATNKYVGLYLTPITDFGDGVSSKTLAEYNELRTQKILNSFINFEQVKEFGEYRSVLWADKKFITKGKPCLYKDKYFLYGANLELYNCCYRIKTDGVCPKDKCFLM
jgi:MoaA/NifB/PqqE/SkfB family radical SAM enzyme